MDATVSIVFRARPSCISVNSTADVLERVYGNKLRWKRTKNTRKRCSPSRERLSIEIVFARNSLLVGQFFTESKNLSRFSQPAAFALRSFRLLDNLVLGMVHHSFEFKRFILDMYFKLRVSYWSRPGKTIAKYFSLNYWTLANWLRKRI